MNTPTPETDYEESITFAYDKLRGERMLVVPSVFARKLERQRDKLREELERARAALRRADDIIEKEALLHICVQFKKDHTLALEEASDDA